MDKRGVAILVPSVRRMGVGGWVGRGGGLKVGGGGGPDIVTGVVGALMTVGATTA